MIGGPARALLGGEKDRSTAGRGCRLRRAAGRALHVPAGWASGPPFPAPPQPEGAGCGDRARSADPYKPVGWLTGAGLSSVGRSDEAVKVMLGPGIERNSSASCGPSPGRQLSEAAVSEGGLGDTAGACFAGEMSADLPF